MNPVSNKMLRIVIEKNTECMEELKKDIEKFKEKIENKSDFQNIDSIYRDMLDRWKTIEDANNVLDQVRKKCNF